MLMLARLVRIVASVVVGIIVIAIVLVVLGASQSNGIVELFNDAGSWLAGPFKGLFNFDSRKLDVAVNWGLAAVVYSIVAALIVRLIVSAAMRHGGGRHTSRV